MFAELLAQEGVREEVELQSRFGLMAFHGGSLERMTDVIARLAAEQGGASLYTVVQPEGFRWHIPSTKVTADQSPALSRFFDHVDVVVTVHGYGRVHMFTTILLGGRNRELAAHLAGHLTPALPEYTIAADLHEVPTELRGQDRRNPVNVAPSAGVQLELPPRVRGMGPFWSGHAGALHDGARPGATTPLVPHTRQLIDALASAAGTWAQ